MKHKTVAPKLRAALPVVTATLLLLFAVTLRFLPPEREDAEDANHAEDEATTSVVPTVPADDRWHKLSYNTHIVTDTVRSGGEARERSVTWDVPTEIVAPLLYELERAAATRRYNAFENADGWTVTALFSHVGGERNGTSNDEFQTSLLSRKEWTSAFETILTAPVAASASVVAVAAEAPPDTESESEVPDPDYVATGGSGYVRIESRGRMNWLWDAEVLRLEPAQ